MHVDPDQWRAGVDRGPEQSCPGSSVLQDAVGADRRVDGDVPGLCDQQVCQRTNAAYRGVELDAGRARVDRQIVGLATLGVDRRARREPHIADFLAAGPADVRVDPQVAHESRRPVDPHRVVAGLDGQLPVRRLGAAVEEDPGRVVRRVSDHGQAAQRKCRRGRAVAHQFDELHRAGIVDRVDHHGLGVPLSKNYGRVRLLNLQPPQLASRGPVPNVFVEPNTGRAGVDHQVVRLAAVGVDGRIVRKQYVADLQAAGRADVRVDPQVAHEGHRPVHPHGVLARRDSQLVARVFGAAVEENAGRVVQRVADHVQAANVQSRGGRAVAHQLDEVHRPRVRVESALTVALPEDYRRVGLLNHETS